MLALVLLPLLATGLEAGPDGTTSCTGETNTGQTVEVYCYPYQTCCHGQCCTSAQSCKKLPAPYEGWNYQQYYCADSFFTAASVIRVVLLPMFTLLLLLATAVAVIRPNLGEKPHVTYSAAIIVFLCIFVLFSPNWPIALLIVLSCYLVIMLTKSTTLARVGFAIVVSLVVFAIILGGLGLGALLIQSNSSPLLPALRADTPGPGSASMSATSIVRFQSSCAAYYNYFWEETPIRRPWDADTAAGHSYWGYCSLGWLNFLQFIQVLIVLLYFYFIVAIFTVLDSGAESSEQEKQAGYTRQE